jgi:anaerobic selenocysteine-containing dehydrogenase
VELKRQGYVTVPRKYKKYEEVGFKTSTRKVEICSTVFEQLGYDPLPSFVEPAESPVSTPDLARQYPLILITGGRNIMYFNSEGRQIPELRKLSPDPQIEIHPTTAREMGIDAGNWVWVETPKVKGERVKLRARLTPDIDPRVVHAEHGWWFPEDAGPEHGCFNSSISVVLSDESPKDPICGSVPLRGTLCRIYSE